MTYFEEKKCGSNGICKYIQIGVIPEKRIRQIITAEVNGIKKKLPPLLFVILITLSVSACSFVTAPPVPDTVVRASGVTLQSEKKHGETPEVSGRDKSKLADGNGAFAFALYQQLKEGQGNLFYSPYNISSAMAMTYAGANGATETQMAEALGFELPQSKLHPAFNWLESELAKRGEGAQGKDSRGFRLEVANAIWGQKNYEFRTHFLDILAENYGAGLRILDFMKEPEQSRITINDWVSEQTEERIKDIIPKGVIDPDTRLVLTNAIYFNSAWEHQLHGKPQDLPFYLLEGGKVTVPVMNLTASYGYTKGGDYQAVEVPYSGLELSMVILLPDEGKFMEFEDELEFSKADSIISRLDSRPVNLTMPKFEFESNFGLAKVLSAMGMTDAFSKMNADFSAMAGNEDLYIKDVVHKAFVSVDEKGTEAAAATGIVVEPITTRAGKDPVVVTVDRPFIFLVRDIDTGAILFIGRVLNPEA